MPGICNPAGGMGGVFQILCHFKSPITTPLLKEIVRKYFTYKEVGKNFYRIFSFIKKLTPSKQ